MISTPIEDMFESSLRVYCADTMSDEEIVSAKKQVNSQNMFVILMNSFHEAIFGFTPLKVNIEKYSPSKSIEVVGFDKIDPANALLIGTECVSVMCTESKIFKYEAIDSLFDSILDKYEDRETLKVDQLMPVLMAKILNENLHLDDSVSALIDKKNQPIGLMSHGLN